MILIDTHIWIWWVTGSESLPNKQRGFLEAQPLGTIAISSISCWEISKLVELGRLQFSIPVEQWLKEAVHQYNIRTIDLEIPIVVESTRLPSDFHKDPADQMIDATARVFDIPLLTADSKILNYPFVKLCSVK